MSARGVSASDVAFLVRDLKLVGARVGEARSLHRGICGSTGSPGSRTMSGDNEDTPPADEQVLSISSNRSAAVMLRYR